MVGDDAAESAAGGGRFLTMRQVGDELAVTESQIYALLRSGELVGIQIGGRGQWRIERAKLEDYIAQAYLRTAAALPQLPNDLPAG